MEKIRNNLKACDLEHIFIDRDFISWKEELSIASVEMQFCQNLFSTFLNETDDLNQEKYANIVEKLNVLKSVNNQLKKELFALEIQFEGYIECQDMQCDSYYMSIHLAFREKIEKHFVAYAKLKKKLLSKINK